MIIKAGTILTTEEGAYSSFQYHGPFKVLKDFDQREVCALFNAIPKMPQRVSNWKDPEDFVAWLATNGYIEDLEPVFKWYLGDYGWNPEINE